MLQIVVLDTTMYCLNLSSPRTCTCILIYTSKITVIWRLAKDLRGENWSKISSLQCTWQWSDSLIALLFYLGKQVIDTLICTPKSKWTVIYHSQLFFGSSLAVHSFSLCKLVILHKGIPMAVNSSYLAFPTSSEVNRQKY